MTINSEQIQALLEKAESDDLALNGNEISNQLRHLADNEIDSDSFAVVTENYNGMETEFERPITDLAIDAAEMIDKLLAERDADKALIAELKNDVDAANARVDAGCAQLCKQDDLIVTLRDACSQWERKAISNFEECAEMSARIEELERANEVMTSAALAMRDDMREARTLTVKLPSQTDFDDPLSAYEAIEKCRDALSESCASAGITLDVGE